MNVVHLSVSRGCQTPDPNWTEPDSEGSKESKWYPTMERTFRKSGFLREGSAAAREPPRPAHWYLHNPRNRAKRWKKDGIPPPSPWYSEARGEEFSIWERTSTLLCKTQTRRQSAGCVPLLRDCTQSLGSAHIAQRQHCLAADYSGEAVAHCAVATDNPIRSPGFPVRGSGRNPVPDRSRVGSVPTVGGYHPANHRTIATGPDIPAGPETP